MPFRAGRRRILPQALAAIETDRLQNGLVAHREKDGVLVGPMLAPQPARNDEGVAGLPLQALLLRHGAARPLHHVIDPAARLALTQGRAAGRQPMQAAGDGRQREAAAHRIDVIEDEPVMRVPVRGLHRGKNILRVAPFVDIGIAARAPFDAARPQRAGAAPRETIVVQDGL